MQTTKAHKKRKGASSWHVPGPTGQMARSWQNQILGACGAVSAQIVNIPQTSVSQRFFRLFLDAISTARQTSGWCQLTKRYAHVPPALCVTYVCPCGVPTRAPHGQGVPARHKAAFCAARLRATRHPVSKQLPSPRQRCCLCRLFAPRLLLPLLGLPPMMKFGLQHPLPPVPAGLGED